MVGMGSAQIRVGYSDETVTLSTRTCPAFNRVQSMLSPSSPHCRELRAPHQTGFRGLVCPLVHQMRRRKVVRKTRSPKVRPLPLCSKFTSCYGTNPQRQRRTHRKATNLKPKSCSSESPNRSNTRFSRNASRSEYERITGSKDTLLFILSHTQSAVSIFRRSRGERRFTAQAPVNPIRFSCESKRILLRSCWSSCSPFDIAETYGFGGNAR